MKVRYIGYALLTVSSLSLFGLLGVGWASMFTDLHLSGEAVMFTAAGTFVLAGAAAVCL